MSEQPPTELRLACFDPVALALLRDALKHKKWFGVLRDYLDDKGYYQSGALVMANWGYEYRRWIARRKDHELAFEWAAADLRAMHHELGEHFGCYPGPSKDEYV